jgi:DNA repair protein RadC
MSGLFVRSGGRYRSATASEVCEAASAYVFSAAAKERPSLASPRAARDYLLSQAGLDVEQFGVIYLDKRHRLLKIEIVSTGTIDGASVHPREIVKGALREGAAALILFHNHPSMVCEPSEADNLITRRLKEALALVDIRVLDHLIVAGLEVCSLAERGVL